MALGSAGGSKSGGGRTAAKKRYSMNASMSNITSLIGSARRKRMNAGQFDRILSGMRRQRSNPDDLPF